MEILHWEWEILNEERITLTTPSPNSLLESISMLVSIIYIASLDKMTPMYSFYFNFINTVIITISFINIGDSEKSLRLFAPHGLYSPWNSPGQTTGVGSLSLLQGDLPNPGIKPRSPTLQADSLPAKLQGKPNSF